MIATAPGCSSAISTPSGRRAATFFGSVRYSTVSRVPEYSQGISGIMALFPLGVLGARKPFSSLMDTRVQSHSGTNEPFLQFFDKICRTKNLTKVPIRARLVISF